MVTIKRSYLLGAALMCGVPLLAGPLGSMSAWAQAPAATAPQRGTVKAISGNNLTIAVDAGPQLVVTVPEGTSIRQAAPGSTTLSPAQLTDISVGDRILVSGKNGDAAGSFNVTRIIVMKSGDIAQKHAAEQADWQKRGMGGIITAVDAGSGTITFSSGAKKIQAQTASTTIFRRYAGDSIKFEDAKLGTIAQIQAGDQLQVRGAKSEDGSSIQAEEIVSGSFRDLSGTLATINPTAGTVSLKDLTTKKMMTVTITPNSDLRKLPPEIAARFAARQRGGATGAQPGGAQPAQAGGGAPAPSAGGRPGGGGRAAGMDLSRMLARLPNVTLADLHTGDAVMIVASQSQPGSDIATAVTLLGGVEPILAATPNGSESMTLSPWSVGGGAPEGGGAQ